MIHSFLLMGQSNAGGRGFPAEVEPIDRTNLLVLRNGRWRNLYIPVNPDRVTSGICLAETFAESYAKDHPDVQVGIIPCADGGSSMKMWKKGGLLYDNAVNQSRLALRTSTIAGVLWHQGESDCRETRYIHYEERLTSFIRALRRDLDIADVPFILGGLGDYLSKCQSDAFDFSSYTVVNEILGKVARQESHCGFAPAVGLTANPDNMHFNAKSLREFGLRYYEVFRKLEDPNKVFAEKDEKDGEPFNAIENL